MIIEDSNTRILVIDDDNGPRQSIRFLMKAWEVDLAESGLVGLDKIRETQYDVIILDLRMPQMNGIEVLRELRVIDPDVAVIMSTAFADIDSAAEAVRLGADDYQCKPFKAEVMRQALYAAVDRCRDRRRNRVLLSEARNDQDKLMQELLQKGQDHDVMRETAAGVCHDVNNQLQTAAAIVETMSMTQEDFDLSQKLRLAHSSLERCKEIVHELIKEPEPQSQRQSSELKKLVEDVLHAVPLGKIELRLDVPPVQVAGEYLKLYRALYNIVHNAVDAIGPRGGRLTISTQSVDGMIDLSVRDDAGGVAEPEQVFNLNYTRGKARRHGLGLHIARSLMQDCGGNLRLRNFAGTGAAFILSFRRVVGDMPARGLHHRLAESSRQHSHSPHPHQYS